MKTLHAQRALAISITALLTSACSSATYPTGDSAARQTLQLEVTNHNWMDVTVYAVTSSQRVRMGTVTSGRTERFSYRIA